MLVAGGVALAIYDRVHELAVPPPGAARIDSLEVVRTTITIAGFVGAVLAGVYAYRKQRLAEGDARRADAEQLAERYARAAEQLGHEKAAVRLAGVYAMARLADDWPEQRQVCIDVLCAYLRMPYEPDPESPKHREGEREVRLTITRVIRDHLRDPGAPTTWCGRYFDLTGATFDGCDFSGCRFTGGWVSFVGATFSGTLSFFFAAFRGGWVSFEDAVFNDCQTGFNGAEFSGGRFSMTDAVFRGGFVSFREATFSGGEVDLGRVTVADCYAEWGPFERPDNPRSTSAV